MARIRSVKPEFWSDRRLATRVSRDARLLYVALWNFADEHGRLHGDARYVKGNCLPYDDDLGLGDIDRLLAELERAERIQRYDHDGDPYIFLPKLASHQRLEADKVPSRLPEPPPVGGDPRSDGNQSESRADKSAPRSDLGADESALLYVAGGRGQVAGGRGQVAGGRGSDATAPRADDAGVLIGDFLSCCRERPPDQFLKRLGRDINAMLDTGTAPAAVRGGLAIVAERGLQPSALAGAVHEHLNRRPSAKASTTDQRASAGLSLAAELEAEGR